MRLDGVWRMDSRWLWPLVQWWFDARNLARRDERSWIVAGVGDRGSLRIGHLMRHNLTNRLMKQGSVKNWPGLHETRATKRLRLCGWERPNRQKLTCRTPSVATYVKTLSFLLGLSMSTLDYLELIAPNFSRGVGAASHASICSSTLNRWKDTREFFYCRALRGSRRWSMERLGPHGRFCRDQACSGGSGSTQWVWASISSWEAMT